MPNIIYFTDMKGRLSARWPGKSVYVKGVGSRKVGQRHLGLVIDKEKNIFYNRTQGYFTFDPKTQTCLPLDEKEIPKASRLLSDSRNTSPSPRYVDFGDAWFLDRLIQGIGYDQVLKTFSLENTDTLYALLFFAVLEGKSLSQAAAWYRGSFASFMYPEADLSAQGILNLLKVLGAADKQSAFFKAHQAFVLCSTQEQSCVLIDLTKNQERIPSFLPEGSFKKDQVPPYLHAVMQKETGFPLFFAASGEELSREETWEQLLLNLTQTGLRTALLLCVERNVSSRSAERFLSLDLPFLIGVSLQDPVFQDLLEKMDNGRKGSETAVGFEGCSFRIVKVLWEPGKDQITGKKKTCFLYLCQEEDSSNVPSRDPCLNGASREEAGNPPAGALKLENPFALLTNRDLPPETVLIEYSSLRRLYAGCDLRRMCLDLLPEKKLSCGKAVIGTLLLSFAAAFLVTLIGNRLSVTDRKYVGISRKLLPFAPEGMVKTVVKDAAPQGESFAVLKQDALENTRAESPASLFFSLRGLKAKVQEALNQPGRAALDQREYLKAFGMGIPSLIHRLPQALSPVFEEEPDKAVKLIAFSFSPSMTDEEITERIRKETKQPSPTSGEEKDPPSNSAGKR